MLSHGAKKWYSYIVNGLTGEFKMYVKEISKNFTDKKVTEILVENQQGLRASFCTLGARISDLSIPSQNGRESLILSLGD